MPELSTLGATIRAAYNGQLTGTPSSTTFLRGDGQWATPSTTGGTGNDFGGNTLFVPEFAGTTLGDKLVNAMAAVAAGSPGSYRVIVPNSGSEYVTIQQLTIPSHGGHITELMGWGMPLIRRNDVNTDRAVFFGSGPGTVHITGIQARSNSGEGAIPGSGYILMPSGELNGAWMTHCRVIDSPKTYMLRINRGGVASVIMSHNYFENIGGGGHCVISDLTFGSTVDSVEINYNTWVNVRTELFSCDRGNFGSHGPVQNKNITIVGNHWTLTPTFTLVGKNSVFACSASENVLVSDNVINGCQASVFRMEDIANHVVIANNIVNNMINWPVANSDARYYEMSGCHMMDVVQCTIIGNIFRNMIYAGISIENNVEKGRAKRIIIANNQIVGAGYAGISIESGPDTGPTAAVPGMNVNVTDTPHKLIPPYDDASFYIGGNMIGHITKTIAQTGQRTLANCGRGIVINSDYDIRFTSANKIYECDGPAIWKVGRPMLNSSPIGPLDQTCLQEIEYHPTVNFRGSRFKNDSARGKVVSAGLFVGWVDLMELGIMAEGILDVSFYGGDNHYNYKVCKITWDNTTLTQTLPRPGALGNLTGTMEIRIDPVTNRVLQARCPATADGVTYTWSVDFQGDRMLGSTVTAINRCKEYKMAYASFDGTTDWLGPNALTLGTATVVEAQIPRTLGVWFGDMNGGLGEQAAFDGVTNHANGTCAQKAAATFAYIGKAFTEKHIFSKAVVYGSNNAGFWAGGNPQTTLEIYGSNDMPTSSTDGTLIGTLGPFADAADNNETAGRTVISTDTTNGYTHIWVEISQTGAGLAVNIGELVLFEQAATASKQLFWSAWFAPTSETWSANMPLLHVGTAGAPVLRIALTTAGRIEVVAAGGTVAVRSVTGVNNNLTLNTHGKAYHLMGSIDSTTQSFWLAANRVSILDVSGAQSFCPLNAVLLGNGNGAIGWMPETADQAGSGKFNGLLGDFFVSAQYIPDIATAAEYTEGLYREPLWLEDNGIALGLAPPRIFMTARFARDLANYHTNRGTAGGFTLNGTM